MHRSVGPSLRDVWSELLRLGYSGGRRLCSTATTDNLMAQNSMRAPSSRTRVDGMLKKSVSALALRDMREGDRPCQVVRLPLVRVPAFG